MAHGYFGQTMALLGLFISTRVQSVLPYDVYEDGSIGQSLPGSTSHSRGSSNLPFSVDADRLSDGVSSVSPLSTTCPSFPLYQNETDDNAGIRRREAANATMVARLEQGVARRGAGSFEKAVARYTLLQGNYSRTEKPSTVFQVHASERWNPSAFAIQQDEIYTVDVPGEQLWQDDRIRVDSGGYEVHYDAVDGCWVAVGRCHSYLSAETPRVPPPRARWMQLVCGVGDFATVLRESANGTERYLPISDADLEKTLFPVGHNLTFVAQETGELVCFANDAEGLYGNNWGHLNVAVTRESWPPNGTYVSNYEDYVTDAPTVRP